MKIIRMYRKGKELYAEIAIGNTVHHLSMKQVYEFVDKVEAIRLHELDYQGQMLLDMMDKAINKP